MSYIPIALRRVIVERAGGCCEYCRLNQVYSDLTFHIEHIIAVSHGGKTVESNLALSCMRCNLYKGSNIAAADPLTDEPTFLYHPRRDAWHDHFRLDDAVIVPLTAEGRATVNVLRMNDQARIEQRMLLHQFGQYPCDL